MLQRLEPWGVSYIIGLKKNARLMQQVKLAPMALAEQYTAKKTKQLMFGQFQYAAGTWDKERRVIARTSGGTAHAARPRIGSRKLNSTCSTDARAATATRPTSFACCWQRWPTH